MNNPKHSVRNCFARAITMIDAANSADPRYEIVEGQSVAKELLYSRRMSEMLERFALSASELLQLACRVQHIERWKIPRSNFPATLAGYHQWRSKLYQFHAERAGEILLQAGYEAASIEQVKKIVGKKRLKVHFETQLLEDIANLVFLEHYLQDFVAQKPEYDEEKWIDILHKIAKKMSPPARAFVSAGKVSLPQALLSIIAQGFSRP